MNATRTNASDDCTIVYAAAPRTSFPPVPPASDDPWADQPTVLAHASYDSEALDAQALFGDILPVVPVVAIAPAYRHEIVMTHMTMEQPWTSPQPAWIDSRNAPLAAVAICGALAAIAAVAAACVF